MLENQDFHVQVDEDGARTSKDLPGSAMDVSRGKYPLCVSTCMGRLVVSPETLG